MFKGTSKAIQNELSDTIFDICREFIRKEIKESDFLAIISDNATDVSNYSQNVGVFRYIKNETIVERFWLFCNLPRGDANAISSRIISCLDEVLPHPEDKQKLVAQCYDGAAVISGRIRGVQTIVKQS